MSPNNLLVIFDCDGVLVDTEGITASVSAEILTELGWPRTPDEILHEFMGCTEEYWASRVLEMTGRQVDAAWTAEFEHRYEMSMTRGLTSVPGVEEALSSITATTCVASNGPHDKIRRNLDRTGLLPLFEGRIFSAQDVAEGKPSPQLFLHAARSLGFPPNRCLVVEDSPHGVTAAVRAGMTCVAYVSGLLPASRLKADDVTLIHDLRDLPPIVSQMLHP